MPRSLLPEAVGPTTATTGRLFCGLTQVEGESRRKATTSQMTASSASAPRSCVREKRIESEI